MSKMYQQLFKKYIYLKLAICIGLQNNWFEHPIIEIPLLIIRGLTTPEVE